MLAPFTLPVAFVLSNVVLLFGYPVPHQNEYVYLLRLKAQADSSFLRGDWTFQGPFSEHLVFNTIFAPVAKVMSIELLGWIGRIVCWILLTALVLEVARRIGVAMWPAAIGVVAFLAYQSRVVGADWLFGTLEAKSVAYVFLFFALVCVLRGLVVLPLIAAGLTLSFHPGVGIWAAPALVAAMLLDRDLGRDTRRWSWLAIVAALPGFAGIISGLGDTDAPVGAWSFVVDRVFPFHLDPFYFGRSSFIALGLMFAFNLSYCFGGGRSSELRLVGRFQLLLAPPMLGGVAAYLLGWDEYLKFFPFRVFPLFTSLLFALLLAREWPWRSPRRPPRPSPTQRLVAACALMALVLIFIDANPAKEYAYAVRENYREWTRSSTDLERALQWVARSTPRDATIILPPSPYETYYLAQRQQIANLKTFNYGDVVGWRERVLALLGDTDERVLLAGTPELERDYNRLTPEQVLDLQRRYGASYIVSRGRYDFEVVHRDGAYRVYELP